LSTKRKIDSKPNYIDLPDVRIGHLKLGYKNRKKELPSTIDSMASTIIFCICLCLIGSLNGEDLYPSYSLAVDPEEVVEWSENRALAYVTTVRLYDYDHYIFQYRHYPCQYFYTDEIQLYHNNETLNQCIHNLTTDEYEFNFQLHFDSRHVEPYILRNIAVQCNYTNCSFSLLNISYIYIGWNLFGRKNNPDCSFDTNQIYYIHRTPYTISESISLRCKSLKACNHSKSILEQSIAPSIQLIYGSSYDLEVPYCSLEKSLSHVMNTNLAETNRLLQQLLELMQRGFGKRDDREQSKLKEHFNPLLNTTTTTTTESK
jgi:hypothetical protein